jgi:hypothetical protein
MKKTIIILSVLLTSTHSIADISITEVAKEIPSKVEAYDGLQNFLGKDFLKYKGQELYIIPKPESLRKYGYRNFIKNIHEDSFDKKNKFKCCDSFNSKYDELQGKYFFVEDVITDSKTYNNDSAYLKLRMKKTNEIVFFKYQSEYKHTFPFLVVSHYEKQKEIFVDNMVLIRPFPKIKNSNQKKITDIITGEEIELKKGIYYKCLDVTIDKKHYELSLLLENSAGKKFMYALLARDLEIKRILTKSEAEVYIKKFGKDNWKIILNEKVQVGFTEEMTRVSWGEPEKINRASYGDQWVYSNNYLYFENGKVKSFN